MNQSREMLYCGVGAAAASLAAITILAKAEGRPVLGPINGSSHWLWGDGDASHGRADLAHSAVGGITNIGAGLMWGALFGALRDQRRSEPGQIIRDGAILGAVAGLLDYGLLPRRFSPGWELALSGRSVVLSMAAMAAGAVVGSLVARESRDGARGSETGLSRAKPLIGTGGTGVAEKARERR